MNDDNLVNLVLSLKATEIKTLKILGNDYSHIFTHLIEYLLLLHIVRDVGGGQM